MPEDEMRLYREAVAAITPEAGRPEIRALVALGHQLSMASAARGENINQVSLDLNDVWQARLADFPDDAVVRLLNLQVEEINALSAAVSADTEAKQIELARIRGEAAYQRTLSDAKSMQGGAVVAFLVVFFVIYWVLR